VQKKVRESRTDWSIMKEKWHIHAVLDTNGATNNENNNVR
jgi:hypothetical protein